MTPPQSDEALPGKPGAPGRPPSKGRVRRAVEGTPTGTPEPAPPLDPSKYQTQVVPLSKIKRYNKNPRKNEPGIRVVAASLQEFGWKQPIVVDAEYVIIIGDTRYLAAEHMGLPAVPIWLADDLTPDQVRALRLMDNRSHEESTWDHGALGNELNALLEADFDLTLTGFSKAELDRTLATDDGSGLEPVEVRPAPSYAWVLIGIPVHRYIEISDEIEKISAVQDIFCEVAANSTEPGEKSSR